MMISIENISITEIEAEAVVNAANTGLWAGSGVCGAIFAAAGEQELTKACQAIGHCDTGSAVITSGFRMKAKFIIHAVGPVYRDGKSGEPELLYGAYQRSLQLAKENGCRSVAFPLISSGVFGYPLEEAWEVAIKACRDFLKENGEDSLEIKFAVLGYRVKKAGEEILAKELA